MQGFIRTLKSFDTSGTEIVDNNSNVTLVDAYEKKLSKLKVRTRNVLKTWQMKYPTLNQFLNHFMSASEREICSFRNCGQLTFKEIISLQKALKHESYDEDKLTVRLSEKNQPSLKHSLPSNIDELLPLFKSSTKDLSTRSKNRIIWLLGECNNSLKSFYERICEPECISSIPTIGSKSIPEIKDFFLRTRLFLEQFPDEESVSSRVKEFLIISPSVLGLTEKAMVLLREKEKSLGYFPIFASIQMYLENQSPEEKSLINGCFKIYKGQKLSSRNEIASLLKLTKERVRQKRNKLFEKLSEYLNSYVSLGIIANNPYRYQMTHYEDDINKQEGTNFNLNFVTWVLGSLYEDIRLIGDPIKSICGYFEKEYFLFVVPNKLTGLFDFEAFIENLDNKMREKRRSEERVNLKSLINAHLKVRFCEDELLEIENTCRSILYLHYPVEVDMGDVLFPQNSYKTNSFILEEILRSTGRPMSLTELIEEYLYEYPEREASESSLRSTINSNNNIVSLGRSSTYALSEWNNSEWRGGTIRSFVKEFIDSTPDRCGSTEAITEYVLQFRPETNEQSIVTNINSDPDKTFVLFFKDGERYFGYANTKYPLDFFPFESDSRTATNNSIYFPKFLHFVEEHHRFPFKKGATEEERYLFHFWQKQEEKIKRNKLDSHAIKYFEMINSTYGHFKMDKNEYEWRIQYTHAAYRYKLSLGGDADLLNVQPSEEIDTWLISNFKDFLRQNSIPSWKKELFALLVEHIMKQGLANDKASNNYLELNV